jgi:phytoene dehydrogenase-like protein
MGEERFRAEGGTRLLAGNALHADVGPEAPLSGVFGWVLWSLAQQTGFPVPRGGSGQLTAALVRRLASRGGRVVCGQRATRIETRRGRAHGVIAGGERYAARRAVVADVDAPQLYEELLGAEIPVLRRVRAELDTFQWDNATFKVDWTLDGEIPWIAERAHRAGTIHVAESVDALSRHVFEMACKLLPSRPYLVLGQYSAADPSRSPEGTSTAWAYTHIPQTVKGDAAEELSGRFDEEETARFADRIEAQVERVAPGFRARVRGRHVWRPEDLQNANRNLKSGALNGGTAQIYQQLVFRPVVNLSRPETPIRGLYLGSASAHPGGGVHGGPGANAAKAALAAARPGLRPTAQISRALQRTPVRRRR